MDAIYRKRRQICRVLWLTFRLQEIGYCLVYGSTVLLADGDFLQFLDLGHVMSGAKLSIE